MNEHTPEEPSWPWPSLEDRKRLTRFLNDPDVLVEEHQRPATIHVRHPTEGSLWATRLVALASTTTEGPPDGPLALLVNPVVAESREALTERIKAVASEARTYGAHVQASSPLEKSPSFEAEADQLLQHRRGKGGQ